MLRYPIRAANMDEAKAVAFSDAVHTSRNMLCIPLIG